MAHSFFFWLNQPEIHPPGNEDLLGNTEFTGHSANNMKVLTQEKKLQSLQEMGSVHKEKLKR